MVLDCAHGLKNLSDKDWGLRNRIILSRVLEPQLDGLRIQSRACILAGENQIKQVSARRVHVAVMLLRGLEMREAGEWMVMWVLGLRELQNPSLVRMRFALECQAWFLLAASTNWSSVGQAKKPGENWHTQEGPSNSVVEL